MNVSARKFLAGWLLLGVIIAATVGLLLQQDRPLGLSRENFVLWLAIPTFIGWGMIQVLRIAIVDVRRLRQRELRDELRRAARFAGRGWVGGLILTGLLTILVVLTVGILGLLSDRCDPCAALVPYVWYFGGFVALGLLVLLALALLPVAVYVIAARTRRR